MSDPIPFPSRAPAAGRDAPDPVIQMALAELLQLGLAVARVAARLAEMEGRAVEALADASAAATRDLVAPQGSLAGAIAAGRDADVADAARAAIAVRVASITVSFDTAARAVRRTAALQARLAEGRPFRAPPFRSADASGRLHAAADGSGRAANDYERGDAPDWGDEIAGLTDEAVVRSIRRDLGLAAAMRAVAGRAAPDGTPVPPGGTGSDLSDPAPARPAPDI